MLNTPLQIMLVAPAGWVNEQHSHLQTHDLQAG